MIENTDGLPGVHLVGSVPLENTSEVFVHVAEQLGKHLKRMPDGETGERSNWINWQYQVLANCPQLEPEPSNDGVAQLAKIRLRNGCTASDVELGALGYSQAALASYSEFSAQKRAGKIPPSCRFQVSLPTALAPIQFYVSSEFRSVLEPIYERRLLEELQEITDAIPREELAIQWDTAVEFGVIEGTFVSHLEDPFKDIIVRLVRLGNAVPDQVELGYHLCYGDSKHKHFVEPKDSNNLVAVTNSLAKSLDRPLNWIHLPVPRDRFDDAFYQPLASIQIPEGADLYLGLVHITDGEIGTQRRIDVAKNFIKEFGIATECGFGRRPAQTVTELLRLHAELASKR